MWTELPPSELPPCASERSGFMSPASRQVRKVHPYSVWNKHYEKFLPTTYAMPGYSADCVPFRWMLRANAVDLAATLHLDYRVELEDGVDAEADLNKPVWVQHADNQSLLLDTFYSAIKPAHSLFFVYAKETPMSEDSRRVLIGVGRTSSVGTVVPYDQTGGGFGSVLWERMIGHTIRPNRADGFLMPYHDLMTACRESGDDIAEFVVHVDEDLTHEFSYAAEHVSHDGAISALVALDKGVQKAATRVPGNWDYVRTWISERLAEVWRMRGPCPGLGSALEALGVANGTFVAYELQHHVKLNENPWPAVEQALANPASFGLDDKVLGSTTRKLLGALSPERRELLELVARFDLSPDQAKRCFDPAFRAKAGIDTTDSAILDNPYVMYEFDRSAKTSIGVLTVDHGVFPDEVLRTKHPLPDRSRVDESIDLRRVRALVADSLESGAKSGHTLLSSAHIVTDVADRELMPTCPLTTTVLDVVKDTFSPVVLMASMSGGEQAFQLDRFAATRAKIAKTLTRRLKGAPLAVSADWATCIDEVLNSSTTDAEEARARQEKAAALQVLAQSRFSVLVGSAGTGKTTLLKALCNLPEIDAGGVLLLAPTGKARVRMQQAIGREAATLAQFLLPIGRYDPDNGRYQPSERDAVQGARTIIVDESSMLTEEQLAALLDGIGAYDRLILVGDHRQLPPIGAGRPFVDIISHLASSNEVPAFPRVAPGYAELTIPRRQTNDANSDAERTDRLIAEWFGGGEHASPEADLVWDRLKTDSETVTVREWNTTEELHQLLRSTVTSRLRMASEDDTVTFQTSYGGKEHDGWMYFDRTDPATVKTHPAEHWQILSPVRAQGPGTLELNRFVQRTWRRKAIEDARKAGWSARTPKPAGPQEIVYGDKVINVANKRRKYYWPKDPAPLEFVANGEIGVVVGQFRGGGQKFLLNKLQVEFTTQQGWSYDFPLWEFSGEEANPSLELAYAITVHKAQGSEFNETIIVLPNPCRLLSRELLYTALTRQRTHMVLLHQGPLTDFRALGGPASSETAARVTNLFVDPNPTKVGGKFLEDRLIHRTASGEAVRSKSEVIIADALFHQKVAFKYEEPFTGSDGVTRLPDFTIVDDDTGETYYWEHLGMLHVEDYRRKWERKVAWYAQSGVLPDEEGGGPNGRLITTRDDDGGGISSLAIAELVKRTFVDWA